MQHDKKRRKRQQNIFKTIIKTTSKIGAKNTPKMPQK